MEVAMATRMRLLILAGIMILGALVLGMNNPKATLVSTSSSVPGAVLMHQRGPDYCVYIVDSVQNAGANGCNFAVGDTVCIRCVSNQTNCQSPAVLNTSKCGRVVMHAISANCTGCPKGAKKITP